jgi:hypothetical protein
MLHAPYNLLGFVVLVLDIFAIISVISGRSSPERKVLWTLIVLLLPVVGMILYYAVGRSARDRLEAF